MEIQLYRIWLQRPLWDRFHRCEIHARDLLFANDDDGASWNLLQWGSLATRVGPPGEGVVPRRTGFFHD